MLYSILVILAVGLIFFGTLMIKGTPEESDQLWSKIRLSTNGTHRDGWCRVIPEVGVRYYGIDGSPIENLEVLILHSYITDEKPPIIDEEPAYSFTVDCAHMSNMDHALRRAS